MGEEGELGRQEVEEEEEERQWDFAFPVLVPLDGWRVGC